MSNASFIQSSFLGGEWSAYYQGRMDNPRYRIAMNRCYNAFPIEQGSVPRRPGFRFVATTRSGEYGRLLPFSFTQEDPYNLEFTSGHLRMFAGVDLVKDEIQDVIAISTANPGVVTVAGVPDWEDGDQVEFLFQNASASNNAAILRNRQFVINMTGTSTFTLADPVTGDLVDGADVDFDPAYPAQVARIRDIETIFTDDDISNLRIVQNQTTGLILSGKHPYKLHCDTGPSSDEFAAFTYEAARFIDGPYMDPPSGALATPSALTGVIDVGITYQAYSASATYAEGDFVTSSGVDYVSLQNANINHTPLTSAAWWEPVGAGEAIGSGGFQSTDIGRLMRFFSQPEDWDEATTYSIGDRVTFNGGFYKAIDPGDDAGANLDKQPDIELSYWAYDTTAARWTWGEILSINSVSSVEVQLLGEDLLYLEPMSLFRMGLYSDTTGWPTNGCYHEGRLWLAGAQPNRLDSSKSNDIFDFTPTDDDGTVADNNAISAVFNADSINTILWLMPDALGIVAGTQEGEWLIQASTLNDPLTPTSIQAHRVQKNGSEFVQPVRPGMTTVFVQRGGRKVLDVLAEVGNAGGQFNITNVTLESKHLTQTGVEEMAYQDELAPIVWARTSEGILIGCTYLRESAQAAAPSNIVAWHHHEMGSGRTLVSVCVGPSVDGDLDSLSIISVDDEGVHHVEILTNLLEPDASLLQAWFLDNAITPSGATVNYDGDDPVSVTFYGLWHLNGESVTVFAGGLDLGEFLVTDGAMTVPFDEDAGFTLAYFQELTDSGEDFGGLAVFVDNFVTVTPPVTVAQTIQGYIPSPDQTFSGTLIPDWPNEIFYVISQDLYGFDLDGTQFAYGNSTTMFTGVSDSPALSQMGIVGLDGYLYAPIDVANLSRICQIDLSDFTLRSTYGIKSNATPVAGRGISGGCRSVAQVWAGGQFIIYAGPLTDSQYFIVQVDPDGGMSCANKPFNFGSNTQILVTPPQSTENEGGVCYGISLGDTNDLTTLVLRRISIGSGAINAFRFLDTYSASTTYSSGNQIGYVHTNTKYKVGYQYINGTPGSNHTPPDTGYWQQIQNPHIDISTIASYTAASIDATWTTFNDSAKGMVYDETDGNLIIHVHTDSVVAVKDYLIKVNPVTGAIVWQVAVPTGFYINNRSRVRRGYLGALQSGIGSPRNLYRLDTIAGTFSNISVYGTAADVVNISDDTTGYVITAVDYSSGTANSPTPLNSTPGSMTDEWAAIFPGSYLQGSYTVDEHYTIPVVIGFTYTTEGQILRPIAPDATGANNGPGFAKTRREHRFGALVHQCIYEEISFGTTFDQLRPANFVYPNSEPYNKLTLYSGIYSDNIEDSYSFDGMLCWQVTRPFPATMLTLGGFIQTSDR